MSSASSSSSSSSSSTPQPLQAEAEARTAWSLASEGRGHGLGEGLDPISKNAAPTDPRRSTMRAPPPSSFASVTLSSLSSSSISPQASTNLISPPPQMSQSQPGSPNHGNEPIPADKGLAPAAAAVAAAYVAATTLARTTTVTRTTTMPQITTFPTSNSPLMEDENNSNKQPQQPQQQQQQSIIVIPTGRALEPSEYLNVSDDIHGGGGGGNGGDCFTMIDEVEWGPREDDPDYDPDQELAPRPRRQAADACACVPPPRHLTTTIGTMDAVPESPDHEQQQQQQQQVCCLDDSCILYACQEECSKRSCLAGIACGNQRLQKRRYAAPLQVFDAGPKGRGLRVLSPLKPGDLCCEYTGQAVKADHLPRLFRRYQFDRRLYIMALDHGLYLDARKKGGLARFINHSCSPNCRVERWKVRGVMRAAVIAIRSIQPGEELTFDYQWERKRGRAPTVCHCGAPTCRGTLEVAKSMEEADLQRELAGLQWEKQNHKGGSVQQRPNQTLINRVVQVFSEQHGEYFLGEVTGYDPDTKQHCILYRHDMNEVWEDLSQEDWMVLLDDSRAAATAAGGTTPLTGHDNSNFIIAKKVFRRQLEHQQLNSNNNYNSNGNHHSTPASWLVAAAGGFQFQQQQQYAGGIATKHYLYVQTPVKDIFYSRHIIETCQRNCQVQIVAEQMARPPLNCDTTNEEDVEKYHVLDRSMDGTVWKMSITGPGVAKAYMYLHKNVLHWEKKLGLVDVAASAVVQQQQQLTPTCMITTANAVTASNHVAMSMTAPTMTIPTAQAITASGGVANSGSSSSHGMILTSNNSNVHNVGMTHTTAAAAAAIAGSSSSTTLSTTTTTEWPSPQEIIFPRLIVDAVKRKLHYLRDKCRPVNVHFAASESKSKQFSKLILDLAGSSQQQQSQQQLQQLSEAMMVAKEHAWHTLLALCVEAHAPMATTASSSNKIPANLGFYAGELTAEQFRLLCRQSSRLAQSNVGGSGGTSSHLHNSARLFASATATTTVPATQAAAPSACEDLDASPFLRSFTSAYRCSLWVQTQEDKGRIDSHHLQLIHQARPDSPRQVYMGCAPTDLPRLWSLIQTRAQELENDVVRYWYLGADRVYQPLLLMTTTTAATPHQHESSILSPSSHPAAGVVVGQFFDYVQAVTGATVSVDSMTGDHLRIDGRYNTSNNKGNGSGTADPALNGQQKTDALTDMTPRERADLAQEIIQLQIELYRDQCIRDHTWIFGRDWTLAAYTLLLGGGGGSGLSATGTMAAVDSVVEKKKLDAKNAGLSSSSSMSTSAASAAGSASSSSVTAVNTSVSLSLSSSTSFGVLDRRSAALGATEIAEVVATLGLNCSVAGHAAIILYRYVHVKHEMSSSTSGNGVTTTIIKLREAVLACVFLANKCQKVEKWKRLEAVLQAGFVTFYPGSSFDVNKEEVLVLEEKVISAEKEILESLEYDIFWCDVEWISATAVATGKISSDFVNKTLEVTFSGPILGAGAELWLKYGAEYVFAVTAAFLKGNLPVVLTALSLIPLKVSQAAELLVESAKFATRPPLDHKKAAHPILEGGRELLDKFLPRIKETCIESMKETLLNRSSSDVIPATRYHIVAEQSRCRRIISGVPTAIIKAVILPFLDGIIAESSCSVYIGRNAQEGYENIVVDGQWRSVAIAEHLLRVKVGAAATLPESVDASAELRGRSKVQAKVRPGMLKALDVKTSNGWDGTIYSDFARDIVNCSRLGGKSCVAGKISEVAVREVGLRWWIPPKHGPSPSGAIHDMCLIRSSTDAPLAILGRVAKSVVGQWDTFLPALYSCLHGKSVNGAVTTTEADEERQLPVSLQRWPPEKVGSKESSQFANKLSADKSLQIGFSAAALQEMQLLTQLHGIIPSPQGHPNFVLPVAVSVPGGENKDQADSQYQNTIGNGKAGALSQDDPLFSLFRSNEENEKAAAKEQDVKACPHLVFHPAPFVMQRFVSGKIRTGDLSTISSTILSAWFHDLLSALVHCHSNHIVMRNIMAEQIIIDHSGVAKFGGFYRARVLSHEDRQRTFNPHRAVRTAKKKDDDDDVSSNPYVAPEILLGCPKPTKESDVWSMGCLMANLLLGKPFFVGKDRETLLTSQYKIVGRPDKDNFEEAAEFPQYKKPSKRYKRGVEKALSHMLKDSSENAQAIDLLSRMLHLDPRKRCTAAEALGHDLMVDYMDRCTTKEFRNQYVHDWLALKQRMMEANGLSRHAAAEEKRAQKRRAMMMAASAAVEGNDDDDLYAMDDMIFETSAARGEANSYSKRTRKTF